MRWTRHSPVFHPARVLCAAMISSTTCCAGVASAPLPSDAPPRPAPVTIATRPSNAPTLRLRFSVLNRQVKRHFTDPAAD